VLPSAAGRGFYQTPEHEQQGIKRKEKSIDINKRVFSS
jgi:hypothetical protein